MNKKHENLLKAGLFNPNYQKINDSKFCRESSFFDPCDQLQVRYEMIRSHMVEGYNVSDICKRFGITRQTFYTILQKLADEGTAGLLQKKPGPRGPSKLNKKILCFIEERVNADGKTTASELVKDISQTFNISLHKRTIEKFLTNMHKKKLCNSGKDTG